MKPDYDHLFILVLIGDSNVGKSCLLTKFVDNTYTEGYIATSGIDLKVHSLQIEGRNIRLQIWDTAGQERFRAISSTYYRGAHGIVIAFDITNIESFNNVNRWLLDIGKFAKGNVNKILVGTKSDLAHSRQVTEKAAQDFALSNNLVYLETSAKTGDKVNEVFELLATQIRRRLEGAAGVAADNTHPGVAVEKPATGQKQSSSCC